MTQDNVDRQFEAGDPVMLGWDSADGSTRYLWPQVRQSLGGRESSDPPSFTFTLAGVGPIVVSLEEPFVIFRSEDGTHGVPLGEWRVDARLRTTHNPKGRPVFLPKQAELRCSALNCRVTLDFALDDDGRLILGRYTEKADAGVDLSTSLGKQLKREALTERAFEIVAGVGIAQWHDGTEITAEDVYPIQRAVRGKRSKAVAERNSQVAATIAQARRDKRPQDEVVADEFDEKFPLTGDTSRARYLIRKSQKDGYPVPVKRDG
jgi:hypothetical protein